jgi:ribosomal protein S3AE
MVSHIKVSTLDTLIFVDDPKFPDAIFTVDSSEGSQCLYQYIRLDKLPDELRELVRQSVWKE